jgi:ABC-type transport system involved in multi-copper enzyme maturation permease subunit
MILHRQLGIEIRKTYKHPALWIGLLALFLLLGMFILVSHLQIARGVRASQGGIEKDLLAGLAFYNWISILVYAVIGAVIAAYDYPDRSIQLWLGRGVGRPLLLWARLAAILFFGLLITCFSVSSLLLLGALSRFLLFGGVETTNLNLSALLPVIPRLFWSALPYLALALLLGIVSRSPLVAAAGTIVYGCVFEMLALQAGGRFPVIVRYLPASWSQVLQASNAALDRTAAAVNATQMSGTQAILWIGVIFLALSTAALIIFLRQDLGG